VYNDMIEYIPRMAGSISSMFSAIFSCSSRMSMALFSSSASTWPV
jgi:hypothetical protein